MIVTIVACVAAPAVFWIAYYRWKDSFRPEPLASLGGTYLLGIAAGMLCLRAYQLGDMIGLPDAAALAETDRGGFLLHALLVIGPLEEMMKALPFLVVLWRFRELDEPVDGIVYAACLALGFASYENLHYLGDLRGAEAVMRAFASPLTHTVFASVWGFAFAWAKLRGRTRLHGVAALAIAAVLHGLYDFLATDPGLLRIGSAALVAAVWAWQIWIFRRLVPKPVPEKQVEPVEPNPSTS